MVNWNAAPENCPNPPWFSQLTIRKVGEEAEATYGRARPHCGPEGSLTISVAGNLAGSTRILEPDSQVTL